MSDATQPDANASAPVPPPPYGSTASSTPPAYGPAGGQTPPPYDPSGGQTPPPYDPSGGQTPPPASAFNGFGLAALILGVVGFGLAFVPFVDYVSGILPVIGVGLGIVGLVIKRYKKPLALAGLIVSAIAAILSLVMAIVYTVAFTTAATSSLDDAMDDYSTLTAPGEEVSVVLTVEGSVASSGVSYSASDADDSASESSDQALPFTKEFTTTVGGELDFSYFSVSADLSDAAEDASISCSISVDGEVVSEDTQTGAYAYATCDWTATGSTDSGTGSDSGDDSDT